MIGSLRLGHLKITPGPIGAVEDHIENWIAEGSGRHACIPLNLTKYVMSRSDAKLAGAINKADLVVADGVPIVWLARRIGWRDVHRVTGVELAERLLARAKAENWRLYFLGSRPENLETAIQYIKRQFSDPPIVGYRNGYFNEADIPRIIEDINNARPDILFLGLGLPQKEYFIADHFDKLDVRFCITVGGAIDIWGGAKTRAPAVVQKMGLEWLYRSFYDLGRAGLVARYGLSFTKDLLVPPRRG